MSVDRNKETHDTIKQELESLRAKCADVIHHAYDGEPENFEEKTTQRINSYVEGLHTEIQNSKTSFSTDCNLLTTQFLIELKKKTEQTEDMIVFTKRNIYDVDAEIERLQALIDIANVAKHKPKTANAEVTPEHIQKAKEKFLLMKTTLRGLIDSMFPDYSEAVTIVLGDLMHSKLNDTTNGYLPITAENSKLMEILKDMKIVTPNPYNGMEVKLTYN